MFETLLRPHDVHQVPKLISIDSVVEQVKLHDLKREQRRLEEEYGVSHELYDEIHTSPTIHSSAEEPLM